MVYLLPDRDVLSQPWDEIAMELIDPWEIKGKKQTNDVQRTNYN